MGCLKGQEQEATTYQKADLENDRVHDKITLPGVPERRASGLGAIEPRSVRRAGLDLPGERQSCLYRL